MPVFSGPAPDSKSNGLSPALFADILMRTQVQVCGFVRGLLGDEERARDITQDVFVDAWRLTQRVSAPFTAEADEGAIRRWLFHAAYWRTISAGRRDRMLRWQSLDMSLQSSADFTAEHFLDPIQFDDLIAEAEALRAALATLSAEDVACILLNVVQGFTASEIAQILRSTPDATKRRLSRAKQRLRVAYFAQNPPQPRSVRSDEHK